MSGAVLYVGWVNYITRNSAPVEFTSLHIDIYINTWFSTDLHFFNTIYIYTWHDGIHVILSTRISIWWMHDVISWVTITIYLIHYTMWMLFAFTHAYSRSWRGSRAAQLEVYQRGGNHWQTVLPPTTLGMNNHAMLSVIGEKMYFMILLWPMRIVAIVIIHVYYS